MNEHGMNENEIRELLGGGIGEEPPIVGGPAAVFAGARTRAVRTRAVTGTLSVVAVLGLAAGAVALSGGSGDSGSGPVTAGGPGGRPSVSGGQPPANMSGQSTNPGTRKKSDGTAPAGSLPTVPAPKPGPGQVLLDGRSALDVLRAQLPAGLTGSQYVIQDSYRPQTYGVQVYGGMSVDDGSHKPGAVSVIVQQNTPRLFEEMTCASLPHNSNETECQEFPQADGSRVTVYRDNQPSPTVGGAPTGVYAYEADRIYPNGLRFAVRAENDGSLPPGGKATTPTRTAPVLTRDQLQAIVLDQRWALTVPEELARQAKNDIAPVVDLTQKDGATK
ncbi:MAG: hypothetical protein HOV87_25595 [Catenulispora sp.]|nr:hypothetical protein [Catenulispora sp.]